MKRLALALALLLLGPALALAQAEKTVQGTLVDGKCFIAGGFKANEHMGVADCGTKCAKSGIPVGLVDAKNNYFTVLAPSVQLAEHVGSEIRIKGKVDNKQRTITPDKIEVKKNGTWQEVKIQAMM